MIRTERLNLLPFTIKQVQAVLNGKKELEELIGSRVPEEWPSPAFAKMLESKKETLAHTPEASQWSRIVVDWEARQLVGEIGCKGGPDENGVVEIGYGIVESFRNKGYGTEMVKGLVEWLKQKDGVIKIVANCLETNQPSIKVLEKSGFKRTHVADELIHWEIE
ncbi:GNAT family N-acetyltransferase [Planomicrobium sp. CPCC 101110]|uniref:GNAT family N-acetyltransferase n=1 Tax=Planomicrobium sp. CPCC 101110 TaxID=2599619 RepID=UPI0011B60B98|nr:GNAT family N-acetyltransferase [Planomicrobium sp. CPCC 101110]TWT25336.1 GNAT family N-acetyltransferase [Planomicrobium sp. CPCC 101110]